MQDTRTRATKSNFGQTWWGAQWLNALTRIDYDNRLPRGRTYANKGAVTRINIDGHKIHALVQGTRPQPYRVEIEVPPMPAKQAAALLDALAQDPVIISKMLNRELDPVVLDRARALGIQVFPTRWNDLTMRCSCPDWAVPCKHLAAVIYLISREIDGNPFLVFSLKGIDLAKELQARHVSIEREAEAALPALADLIQAPAPHAPSDLPAESEGYAGLDYSTLPELTGPLLGVLPASPAFYPHGDFREVYEKALKRAAKTSRQTLERVPEASEDIPPVAPDAHPRIIIDGQFQPVVEGVAGITRWNALTVTLDNLAEADLPDLQPEIAALYHARMAALHLLAAGAVLPQVFATDSGATGLRWLPAMLDVSITQLMARLAQALPDGMVLYRQGRSEAAMAGDAQALALVSLFLNAFIHAWSVPSGDRRPGDKALELFFGTGHARLGGPGEGAVPPGIQVWLSRFHLGHQPNIPVMRLAETGNGFALSLDVENRETPLAKPVPMARFLVDQTWAPVRYGVLKIVSLLAEFFPPLNGYVSDGARQPVALSADALPDFLFDTLPVIRLLGIRALLPKALERVLRPRLSMRVSGSGGASSAPAFLSADDLLHFDWAIAIGDAQLSAAEFEKLVKNARGIVRFRNEYVYLDPAEIQQLSTRLKSAPAPSGAELLRIALAEEYAGAPIVLDDAARSVIRALTEANEVPAPDALQATLRPYQARGYAWLYRNFRAGFGSVIADDMGLGKTLQVIATLLKLKEEGGMAEGGALVVVPTSLLTNWTKEIERFAPGLSAGVYHGATRKLPKELPDVLLTTYGVARTDQAKLRKLPWQVVVIDEAQNIKNPGTAQTKAVKSIPARSFIAMSGTPVENRMAEFWSIMDFANRGFLGNLTGFTNEFARPIQNDHDQAVVQRFKKVTAPFLLRRLKSDKSIITDLPDKIEQDQYCELTPAQAALYESITREALLVIGGESDTFKRQGLVLQMILALKQVCNHPAQYLKRGSDEFALSGKAERLLELLDAIHASHEKVLVFTQFREMGELLAGWIQQRFGRPPQFLHGGVPRRRRDEMVDRFQNDSTERIFLLSLKAGGTGLNLTAASNVIHYDLWWNPAVEAQATDRAYRIGQQQNVQVHRLITRSTFEERINEMIQSKRELADLTVDVGEKWVGNLSDRELRDLFSLHAAGG